MVTVPLPSANRAGQQFGASRGFLAPAVAPAVDPTGAQIQRLGSALERSSLQINSAEFVRAQRLSVAKVKRHQALAMERSLEHTRAFNRLKGQEASDSREAMWESLQQEIDSISQDLDEGAERELFGQVMSPVMLSTRRQWDGHEDEQVIAADIGASRAVLAEKIELARAQAQNPEPQNPEPQGPETRGPGAIRVPGDDAPARVDYLQSVKVEAQRLGEKLFGTGATEQIDRFVKEQTTLVHSGTVEDMVTDGRATEARSYLGTHQKEITADTAANLRNLVRRASVQEEGAQVSLGIRDQLNQDYRKLLTNPNRSEVMPTEMPAEIFRDRGFAMVRQMYEQGKITIEVRDAALGEVGRMAAERSQQWATQRGEVQRQAETWVQANPGVPMSAMPSVLRTRVQAFGLMPAMTRFSRSDGNYTTNEQFFRLLQATPDGSGMFRQENTASFLTLIQSELSPDDARRAMAMRNQFLGTAGPDDLHLTSIEEDFKAYAERLKVREDSDQYLALRRAFLNKLNMKQALTGESAQKNRDLVTQSFAELERDRVFLFQTGLGFDWVNPDDPPSAFVSDRGRAAERLRARGRHPGVHRHHSSGSLGQGDQGTAGEEHRTTKAR